MHGHGQECKILNIRNLWISEKETAAKVDLTFQARQRSQSGISIKLIDMFDKFCPHSTQEFWKSVLLSDATTLKLSGHIDAANM